MPHQLEALDSLGNGRILYGGVGSGKSATAIAYYVKHESPKDVYVITTAKKRDSLEWLGEAAHFGIGCEPDGTLGGILHIDSWNNIGKYTSVQDCFFIFDEQRLVGSGTWVKSFLRIASINRWILLSATPGDIWLDYAPVFIANGYYRNITDFKRQHVLYEPYVKFPKVKGYIGQGKLERLRNEVLVEMPYLKHTKRFMNYIDVGYDKELIKKLAKERWNYDENRPMQDAAELWRTYRMVVNSDPSRLRAIRDVLKIHPRLIVFYNFNYELEILRTLADNHLVKEWNGHQHDPVPEGDSWVYLVQYTAGSEGWNCRQTDGIAFYSLPYSYKNFAQAQGRIDRLDTKYKNLYYYILKSSSLVDFSVGNSLKAKQDFNERKALKDLESHGLLANNPV
jgi:hypothetical protein